MTAAASPGRAGPSTAPFYTSVLPTIWRIFGPHRRALVAGVALRFLMATCMSIPINAMVWVIDCIRTESLTGRRIVIAIAITVIATVGQYIFGYFANRFAWISTFYAIGDARERALQHVQSLPIGTVAGRDSGDISTALTSDFDSVGQFAHGAMPTMFGAIALPLCVFLSMVFIDPPLAVAVLVSVAFAVPLFMWANRIFKKLGAERADLFAGANGRIVEYVQGIGVLRAFNRTGARMESFRSSVADLRSINNRMTVKLVPLALISMGLVQFGTPIVIAAGAYRLFGGQVDAGTLVVFLVLVLRVYAPLIAVALQVEHLRFADASLERIGRILDLSPQQSPVVARHQLPEGNVAVSFEKVSFSYNANEPVLTDVSFTVPPRTVTAIVGPSGAGKSTVLNLVARFWDPASGAVRLGEVDVRELTEQQLFDTVSVVFQDVYLFQGSVADNIAFSRPDATTETIESAARAAQAHDFIVALPDGYATRVGEGGSTLSGGERQRISIARAILKRAPVVLLDEATASIDPLNERAVTAALAELVRDTTLFVVAHRLSTIRHADQILVVDGGRIVAAGTHDQLIAEDGLYARLWRERERAAAWTIRRERAPASTP